MNTNPVLSQNCNTQIANCQKEEEEEAEEEDCIS